MTELENFQRLVELKQNKGAADLRYFVGSAEFINAVELAARLELNIPVNFLIQGETWVDPVEYIIDIRDFSIDPWETTQAFIAWTKSQLERASKVAILNKVKWTYNEAYRAMQNPEMLRPRWRMEFAE